MPCVFGIDASWTERNPSGVALAVWKGGWRLVAACPSYAAFHTLATGRSQPEDAAAVLDPARLLASCARIARQPVLIALDMPLAHVPITGRRASDTAVSRAYAARKCATHSPTPERPGPIATRIREQFAALGYPLLTGPGATHGLLEVYPHPALVELTGASHRLPYKVARSRSYWPYNPDLHERKSLLLREWSCIVQHLDAEIEGVREALPLPLPGVSTQRLKAFEDTLDAVVCAWVAIMVLEGRARPFGDALSAIWIPNARTHGKGRSPGASPRDAAIGNARA